MPARTDRRGGVLLLVPAVQTAATQVEGDKQAYCGPKQGELGLCGSACLRTTMPFYNIKAKLERVAFGRCVGDFGNKII